jgi:methionine sulfoxide reductase heme-binding subunit
MDWLRANWLRAVLNWAAMIVVAVIFFRGNTDWNAKSTFDPMLESGKWAIRFLLFCLAMTPLNSYFGWRSAIKLRKPAGLWAFAFATLHLALLYIADGPSRLLSLLQFPLQPFIAAGLIGLIILVALAATSNRWSMKGLGKNWKRLHRLVYVAGVLVVFHAMLAATSSKRMFVRDPQASDELEMYLAVLIVLLVVRIPLVRNLLKGLKHLRMPLFARRDL